jgi:catechol 2,3-dioxygenase-like lactoylglutathione lyase family enzyme
MHLNHLDLQVPDVPSTAAFLERYFGVQIQGNRTSPAIIILSDDIGFTLVLQRRRDDHERYPDGFHIGFLVDDPADVQRRHAQLVGDGVGCSPIRENSRGIMFYVTAPGDVTVEVGWRKKTGRLGGSGPSTTERPDQQS